MNDKQSILAKIKKCMALSSSSNEHEAAAALRQAQKLMQTHNLSMTDIEQSEIVNTATKASAKKSPSKWEAHLAWCVSEAFECICCFLEAKGYYVFVGYGANSEIAGYTFEVLLRQAKKSRKAFISKLGIATRTKKIKSADFFMTGWVHSVNDLITKTYHIEAKRKDSLSKYINETYKNTGKLKTQSRVKNPSQADAQAFDMGKDDGKKASLNQAVTGARFEQLSIGATNA